MSIISEYTVERIIQDVAPKVQALTGWDPHLEDLKIQLIRRDQLWEYSTLPRYKALNIDTVPRTSEGKASMKISQKIMPYLALAMYEPLTGTILIMPENFGAGTTDSGLAITIGHELVHRGQWTNNPDYSKKYPTIIRKSVGSNAFDTDADEDPSYEKFAQAYMSLAEGDATFVQEQLKKLYYPDAKSKSGSLVGLLTILLMHSAGGSTNGLLKKMKQYIEGKKIVQATYKLRGREGVNALYSLDMKGLQEKFKTW
jgi:hypothetical protein